MGFPASEGRIEGALCPNVSLQSSQIFTHDDVKPSGPNPHLGLIMSPEIYQNGDEAEGSNRDVRRGGGANERSQGNSLEEDEKKSR